MEDTEVFEKVLSLIKSFNLNFHLEQSPFGAKIFLQKSVIRDRLGMPLKLLSPSNNGNSRNLKMKMGCF